MSAGKKKEREFKAGGYKKNWKASDTSTGLEHERGTGSKRHKWSAQSDRYMGK